MIHLRRLLTLLLGALLLLAAVPTPAMAGNGPRAVQDAAAYRGRLIVVWKQAPVRMTPAGVGVDGVGSAQRMAHVRWSVVTAEPGRSAEVAAQLRRDPRVLAVVPDVAMRAVDWPTSAEPNDPYWASQTDLRQIGVPAAWATTTGSDAVTVAVIDTGVDLTHPDLTGVTVEYRRDEITDTTSVRDDDGHGTHVAGTIVARANNGTGIAGIAPGVRLMPVKVLDANGRGSFADIMDGVSWAAAHGADVINLSLGGTLDDAGAALFQDVIDAAHDAGAVIVAAAGNDGGGTNLRFYPASLGHVVSVAAVDAADQVAAFSTFNDWVDIAAPGTALRSTTPGGTYSVFSGTSMAAPHVSGAAALLRSHRSGLTPDQVEAVLLATAEDLGEPGRDRWYGQGRVDIGAALDAPVPDPMPVLDVPLTPSMRVQFAKPAGRTVLPGGVTSQVFDVTTSAAIEDGMAWRYRWRSVGGVCPSVDTAYFDELAIPFATSMTVDGIRDGFCARVLVTAIDPGRTLGQAISPAVIGHDATAPRIRSRRPTSGSTGASITVSPRFYLNEPVTGVSGVTVQLRNLSSGRLVTAAVSYNRDLRRVTINPALNLRRGTWYRVTVRSGIKDWAGNPLAPTYWRFKTAP